MKLSSRLIGKLIDIDANLLHPDLVSSRMYHVENALRKNIEMFVIPGSTLDDSEKSIQMSLAEPLRYIATVGIHPYNALTIEFNETSKNALEKLIKDNVNVVKCVGECGLDYSDGFPVREVQLNWFRYVYILFFKFFVIVYINV